MPVEWSRINGIVSPRATVDGVGLPRDVVAQRGVTLG